MLIFHEMELINECSMRFAEDKDFRLLVRYDDSSLLDDAYWLYRLLIVSWLCFVLTSPGEANLARGSKRCLTNITLISSSILTNTFQVGANALEID